MCFDIGGSFIKSAVMMPDDQLQTIGSLPVPARDWPALCAALQQLLAQAAPLLSRGSPVAISAAGVVDQQADTILAGNLPAFNGHRVAQELSSIFQRPVVTGNDADCFTLAEAIQGSARDAEMVLGIILGSGVGGGLVYRQQIIRGAGGLTGEWGHGPVTRTEFRYGGKLFTCPGYRVAAGSRGASTPLALPAGWNEFMPTALWTQQTAVPLLTTGTGRNPGLCRQYISGRSWSAKYYRW